MHFQLSKPSCLFLLQFSYRFILCPLDEVSWVVISFLAIHPLSLLKKSMRPWRLYWAPTCSTTLNKQAISIPIWASAAPVIFINRILSFPHPFDLDATWRFESAFEWQQSSVDDQLTMPYIIIDEHLRYVVIDYCWLNFYSVSLQLSWIKLI